VLALLDDPDVSLNEISRTLEGDPLLSARLLRLANSPLFARGQRLDSIHQAIVRLGYAEVRTAVTTIGFIDCVGRDSRAFDMREIFREAVCCASLSRRLARDLRKGSASSAYLAGLLHSMGEIVLGLCFEQRFESCVLEGRASMVPLSEVLEREFGFSAAEIGAHLLGRWRMPEEVVDAVRFKNSPHRSPRENSLAEIVGAAYRTTRALGIGLEWPGDSAIDWAPRAFPVLARASGDEQGGPLYLEQCRKDMPALEESLEILLPPAGRCRTPLLS